MWILNWYVARTFLATFFMAIAVLTFGMTGAHLMKMLDLLSHGIPIYTALECLLYTVPMALAFTIPWASLVSIMLVFGRMSADNEITAMRASGISILQIISPIIVATFIMTCLSLYLQLEVGPRALGNARTMAKEVVTKHPTALFTPGIPVEVDQLSIYIDARDSADNIYGIEIYVLDKEGNIRQDVVAAKGKVETDEKKQVMNLVLEDATISSIEGDNTDKPIYAFSKKSVFSIEYGKQFNSQEVSKRDKYLTVRELFARAAIEKRRGGDTTELQVELNQRVALALAPIAFLMLGMPLAIRTSRRETSIGLFLSVLLASVYFGGVLISDALRETPALYPQYIVWIPPVVFQVFGAWYLITIARK